MEIRKMQISDYESVYALWLSCKGMGLNNIDDSREGIEKFLLRNPETCFVAQDENAKISGAILCGNDGRRGYIYHTCVAENCRGKGIAKALVSAACAALKKLGITKVALVVFEPNAAGNAFWEKLGFTSRTDLVYRDKALTEIERIDT